MKMYKDLRNGYRCPYIKMDVAWYVERCLIFQKVNVERQRPNGKLQPIDIQMWKWEHITIYFITKFPKTPSGVDTIWVIVDKLTKSAQCVPIQESTSTEKLPNINAREVVSRYGLPVF